MIPISHPIIGEEEKRAVLEVLDSGMLAQGPQVARFEEAFARVAGVKHAMAISSGTAALHLALLAHDVGPGDEVITSSFTFIASVNSILFCGAKPVFVDIDPATFNLDPALLEAAMTSRTKAIMPVHLYGQPADMDAIVEIASRHGVAIIEDAAQAVGARFKGRPAGSFGTGCFSLYATKNVMTAEGGMVTTDSDEIADRVQLLRNHGMRKRYQYEGLGYNFRMTDILAAIGIEQLKKLDAWNEMRGDNARRLTAGLRMVATPKIAPNREHVWHQYTVRVPDGRRDELASRLNEAGIGSGVFYPKGAHTFAHVVEAAGSYELPETSRAASEVLSLPVHPSLSSGDVDSIIAAVNSL
ncbi:MAG TPA: DegT/DnrJ/EryC1/StrS family aminotransferase [Candidatus Dormibacteraeota bacterium]|nr:DegT/DnrJ/EryC1/StrS family aminotransferase [Candidatus Dormibacteraeota bacterium]